MPNPNDVATLRVVRAEVERLVESSRERLANFQRRANKARVDFSSGVVAGRSDVKELVDRLIAEAEKGRKADEYDQRYEMEGET